MANFKAVQTTLCLLALLAVQISCQFVAPYTPAPFQITGFINSLTQTTAGPLKGGSITVDGLKVTVPDNLLVTLPSINVGFGELFNNGVANLPGTKTFQASVYGNRVGNELIAGLVYIAQQENQLLQGFIESIDTTGTGRFTVGGRQLVLNDPIGQFGPNYTAHPLWTVDPENPSVRTSTGFPVCIPRSANDAKCPKKNRPNGSDGKPIQKLTFKDPATVTATDPDPRIMMPLAVGDYITYSCTDVGDVCAVYSLDANLGIYTAPGTKPAYVTVEDAQYAVVQQAPNGEDGETRAVAFSTDASASIQMYAIDVNPCTGEETKRNLIRVQVETGAPRGRAVFRGSKTDYSPATREIGFDVSTGISDGPGGIKAGSFVQPIFEYIFPELIVFGDPQIPLDFTLLPYLAKGSGPYSPGNLLTSPPTTPVIVGQLKPWPGAQAPAATSCPPPSPTSSATTLISSTVSATPTAGPSPDSIVINSATATRISGGSYNVNIDATTNNLSAKLSVAIQGRTPVPVTAMTSAGNGRWTFQVNMKNDVTTCTVTSDKGGSSSATVAKI